MKRTPIISMIGRPNVGKSSLFNRLLKKQKKAITLNRPGVTRDRHYGLARFDELPDALNEEAILMDTGGFYPTKIEDDKNFFNIMADSAEIAIRESDLVLFMVDVREGLLPMDEQISKYLRASKKPFWIIVNKYDSDKQAGEEFEFFSLGVDEKNIFTLSAAHGLGIVDLTRRLQKFCQEFKGQSLEDKFQLPKGLFSEFDLVGRVAIIGAPNVGKSTLLNALLGDERSLVSPVAGTTVDPIEGILELNFGKKAAELTKSDTVGLKNLSLLEQYEKLAAGDYEELEKEEGQELPVSSKKKAIMFIDTAGIRRKSHINDKLEAESIYRSLRCITESDIVIVMMDATKGIVHQDRRLIDVALEKGKSIILVLNKYDLLKEKIKSKRDYKEWILDLRASIPWLDYCQLLTLSAKEHMGLDELLESVKQTLLLRKTSISTAKLNQVLSDLVERNPVYLEQSRGKTLKVRYASLVHRSPPTVLLFTNQSRGVPENYKRYLKNGIRGAFSLMNTPIHLIFRTKKDLEKRAKHYDKPTN